MVVETVNTGDGRSGGGSSTSRVRVLLVLVLAWLLLTHCLPHSKDQPILGSFLALVTFFTRYTASQQQHQHHWQQHRRAARRHNTHQGTRRLASVLRWAAVGRLWCAVVERFRRDHVQGVSSRVVVHVSGIIIATTTPIITFFLFCVN